MAMKMIKYKKHPGILSLAVKYQLTCTN